MKDMETKHVWQIQPWQWWVTFTIATLSMSRFFATFKAFTLEPSWLHGLLLLLATLLFMGSMTVLLLDAYLKECSKGAVKVPFGPFEWLARQLNLSGGLTP